MRRNEALCGAFDGGGESFGRVFGWGGNSDLTPASLEDAEGAELKARYGRDAHATFKKRGGASGVGLGRAFLGR